MNVKLSLELLRRGETLDLETVQSLSKAGYIKVSSISNINTPLAQKGILFIYVTEKGKRVLQT